MDNTLYVSLSRQMTLQHELDVIANNVANVNTTGFKAESLTVQDSPQVLPAPDSGPRVVNFVLDSGVVRDFGQGALKQTGGPLNLAIDGEGFFRVSTPQGERYTRDGSFTMDPQGRIVTAAGDPVQGDGGEHPRLDRRGLGRPARGLHVVSDLDDAAHADAGGAIEVLAVVERLLAVRDLQVRVVVEDRDGQRLRQRRVREVAPVRDVPLPDERRVRHAPGTASASIRGKSASRPFTSVPAGS